MQVMLRMRMWMSRKVQITHKVLHNLWTPPEHIKKLWDEDFTCWMRAAVKDGEPLSPANVKSFFHSQTCMHDDEWFIGLKNVFLLLPHSTQRSYQTFLPENLFLESRPEQSCLLNNTLFEVFKLLRLCHNFPFVHRLALAEGGKKLSRVPEGKSSTQLHPALCQVDKWREYSFIQFVPSLNLFK